MPMMTFKGVRISWLIDFKNSGLSMLSAKKAAGMLGCFCGIFIGFTTSYSQRESIRDFGAVRPPPSLSSIHVPTQHSHNSLDSRYQLPSPARTTHSSRTNPTAVERFRYNFTAARRARAWPHS